MDYKTFEKAIYFAVKAHSGQTRKDGKFFILHPTEVAAIASTMTDDPDVLCAAVLHDTVEDTETTAQDIVENFGERIAELVASETEDKRRHMSAADSWKIRKEESIEELKNSDDIGVKILWLSDKLSNIRALARDFDKLGKAVFERFNEKDPKEQGWYHKTVLSAITELKDTAAYKEYEYYIHHVFDDFE
ncbi:MAG: bifunctional (p)ppGpp synthetase/guanosine-3',5'-bis(diphosphate) 3'-pyrophosphohydrolase [Clostridia bacterium]|nr:bifunctional (p)ppGpp synthetase/guanosine-3',5'-bis(diphosphate) 3'-pyrophosphohydrolase [Clostridia bacterium]